MTLVPLPTRPTGLPHRYAARYVEGATTGIDPVKIRAVPMWRDSEPLDNRERPDESAASSRV